jgi:hypothetical protein
MVRAAHPTWLSASNTATVQANEKRRDPWWDRGVFVQPLRYALSAISE